MGETIQFQSRVGKDGVLDLRVPLANMGEGAEVLVTISQVSPKPNLPVMDRAEWHRFVNETYGSCADLAVQRLPQGQFEQR